MSLNAVENNRYWCGKHIFKERISARKILCNQLTLFSTCSITMGFFFNVQFIEDENNYLKILLDYFKNIN